MHACIYHRQTDRQIDRILLPLLMTNYDSIYIVWRGKLPGLEKFQILDKSKFNDIIRG